MKRRIKNVCFITGSRADYDLLNNLIQVFKKKNGIDYNIIVTGSHFSRKHGYSIKNIIADKHKIYSKINLNFKEFSNVDIAKYTGKAIIKSSKILSNLKPNLVFLLGDRYEIFSFAVSCLFLNIPIAHIFGGELTQGAFDDTIRHSISKMSMFHFVSNEKYRKRVIQLGEDPKRVFNVGGISVDNVINSKKLNRSDIEKKLNFKFLEKNILITFHPETLELQNTVRNFKIILNSLKKIKNTLFIFTYPNADTNNTDISKMIEKFVHNNTTISKSFKNLGRVLYLSILQEVDCILGNSSSGILEAPALKTPTINMGERQSGREMASSIIRCKYNSTNIINSIKKIKSKNFLKKLISINNPYGNGESSNKIYSIVKKISLPISNKKIFFDL